MGNAASLNVKKQALKETSTERLAYEYDREARDRPGQDLGRGLHASYNSQVYPIHVLLNNQYLMPYFDTSKC